MSFANHDARCACDVCRAYAAGQADMQRRIVAWLRGCARAFASTTVTAGVLDTVARQIEGGAADRLTKDPDHG